MVFFLFYHFGAFYSLEEQLFLLMRSLLENVAVPLCWREEL